MLQEALTYGNFGNENPYTKLNKDQLVNVKTHLGVEGSDAEKLVIASTLLNTHMDAMSYVVNGVYLAFRDDGLSQDEAFGRINSPVNLAVEVINFLNNDEAVVAASDTMWQESFAYLGRDVHPPNVLGQTIQGIVHNDWILAEQMSSVAVRVASEASKLDKSERDIGRRERLEDYLVDLRTVRMMAQYELIGNGRVQTGHVGIPGVLQQRSIIAGMAGEDPSVHNGSELVGVANNAESRPNGKEGVIGGILSIKTDGLPTVGMGGEKISGDDPRVRAIIKRFGPEGYQRLMQASLKGQVTISASVWYGHLVKQYGHLIQ